MKMNNTLGEAVTDDPQWCKFLDQMGGYNQLLSLAASTLGTIRSQVKLGPYIEDLLQDSLATVYDGVDTWDDTRPPQPWAKTVIKNRLIREVERIERDHGKTHQKRSNDDPDVEPEPIPDIAINVTNEELVDRIYGAARDEKMVAVLRKISRGVPLSDAEHSRFYRFRDKIRREVANA